MGDGGLCVGAAALHHAKNSRTGIKKLQNVYLGKSFSQHQVIKEIKKFNLKFVKDKNIHSFDFLNFSNNFKSKGR